MNGPNHVICMAYVDAAHKENVVSDKVTYFTYVEFFFYYSAEYCMFISNYRRDHIFVHRSHPPLL